MKMWKIYMQIEEGEDVKGKSTSQSLAKRRKIQKTNPFPPKKKQKMDIESQFSLYIGFKSRAVYATLKRNLTPHQRPQLSI